MHNMVYLIGRLTDNPEIKELESGKNVANVTVAVQRSFKNEEGVYETDFFPCSLWNGIAANTAEYCKKGDLVGIKGRLENNSYTDKETGETKFAVNVVVDKISFLASKKDPSHDDAR